MLYEYAWFNGTWEFVKAILIPKIIIVSIIFEKHLPKFNALNFAIISFPPVFL